MAIEIKNKYLKKILQKCSADLHQKGVKISGLERLLSASFIKIKKGGLNKTHVQSNENSEKVNDIVPKIGGGIKKMYGGGKEEDDEALVKTAMTAYANYLYNLSLSRNISTALTESLLTQNALVNDTSVALNNSLASGSTLLPDLVTGISNSLTITKENINICFESEKGNVKEKIPQLNNGISHNDAHFKSILSIPLGKCYDDEIKFYQKNNYKDITTRDIDDNENTLKLCNVDFGDMLYQIKTTGAGICLLAALTILLSPNYCTLAGGYENDTCKDDSNEKVYHSRSFQLFLMNTNKFDDPTEANDYKFNNIRCANLQQGDGGEPDIIQKMCNYFKIHIILLTNENGDNAKAVVYNIYLYEITDPNDIDYINTKIGIIFTDNQHFSACCKKIFTQSSIKTLFTINELFEIEFIKTYFSRLENDNINILFNRIEHDNNILYKNSYVKYLINVAGETGEAAEAAGAVAEAAKAAAKAAGALAAGALAAGAVAGAALGTGALGTGALGRGALVRGAPSGAPSGAPPPVAVVVEPVAAGQLLEGHLPVAISGSLTTGLNDHLSHAISGSLTTGLEDHISLGIHTTLSALAAARPVAVPAVLPAAHLTGDLSSAISGSLTTGLEDHLSLGIHTTLSALAAAGPVAVPAAHLTGDLSSAISGSLTTGLNDHLSLAISDSLTLSPVAVVAASNAIIDDLSSAISGSLTTASNAIIDDLSLAISGSLTTAPLLEGHLSSAISDSLTLTSSSLVSSTTGVIHDISTAIHNNLNYVGGGFLLFTMKDLRRPIKMCDTYDKTSFNDLLTQVDTIVQTAKEKSPDLTEDLSIAIIDLLTHKTISTPTTTIPPETQKSPVSTLFASAFISSLLKTHLDTSSVDLTTDLSLAIAASLTKPDLTKDLSLAINTALTIPPETQKSPVSILFASAFISSLLKTPNPLSLVIASSLTKPDLTKDLSLVINTALTQ